MSARRTPDRRLAALFPALAGDAARRGPLSPVQAAHAAAPNLADHEHEDDAAFRAAGDRYEAATAKMARARSRGLADVAIKLQHLVADMEENTGDGRGGMTGAFWALLLSALRDVRALQRGAGRTTA